MRILRGAGLIVLLGIAGCTDVNPVYCDPQRPGCPPNGGGGDGAAEGPDLAPPDPTLLDLGGGASEDLREAPADLRAACREGADCASRVCQPDGTCAADVIYVNNRGGACGGDHAGTLADPLCGVAEAVTLAARSGRDQIYVFGSMTSYGPFKLDGAQLSVSGPGAFASPTAQVQGQGGSPAITVRGAARLRLDGLELGPSPAEVLSCQADGGAAPELELSRSLAHDGQGSGVYSRGCRVTVRRSALYANSNRGLSADSGGEVLVENSVIAYNRGGAVRLSGTGGRVRFSTLVYNGLIGSVGGVECSTMGGGKLIENSIVYGNGRGAGASQVSSACRLLRSAIDEAAVANGADNRLRAAPDFVSGQDLRLRRGAGSSACCIDQLDAGPGVSDVLVDFDGTSRPQGPRFDIGATEVK